MDYEALRYANTVQAYGYMSSYREGTGTSARTNQSSNQSIHQLSLSLIRYLIIHIDTHRRSIFTDLSVNPTANVPSATLGDYPDLDNSTLMTNVNNKRMKNATI